MPEIYFAIVDRFDCPIYQQSLELKGKGSNDEQVQLIFFSSLDILQDLKWSSSESYFKSIDIYNNSTVSAFVGVGGVKLLLLRDNHIQDNIREFSVDVYEIYIKTIQNPLQSVKPGSEIFSPSFASKVSATLKYRFS